MEAAVSFPHCTTPTSQTCRLTHSASHRLHAVQNCTASTSIQGQSVGESRQPIAIDPASPTHHASSLLAVASTLRFYPHKLVGQDWRVAVGLARIVAVLAPASASLASATSRASLAVSQIAATSLCQSEQAVHGRPSDSVSHWFSLSFPHGAAPSAVDVVICDLRVLSLFLPSSSAACERKSNSNLVLKAGTAQKSC